MCRRSDSLKRKSAVSNGKVACGADFRRKGGIGGKTQSKILSQRLRLSFESVVDFIDTLKYPPAYAGGYLFYRTDSKSL